MILIVGARGNLGRIVTRRLLADGHQVRAMTRNPSKADDLRRLGAEVVAGDLRKLRSLHRAVQGVTTVISAAHSMLGRGRASSEAVDDAGQRELIGVAESAGVEHFIFTSIMGARHDHPIDFWRTKFGVEQYLVRSGLDWTIVRPGPFMEIHAYDLIGKAVARGKRVMLIGPGENPRCFVAARDVAELIVQAIDDRSLRGRRLDIGGPENLSAMQVVSIFERVSGREAKVGHLPLPMVRGLSVALYPLHPGFSRIMRAGILSETTDQTFNPASLLGRVPIQLTRLEDWATERLNQ